jgi:glycosyltransferase involved in cell wall biosynthesis
MKNTVPKVSIIIPTYNRANLLSRAIKSVLDQTFQDFELIIVDDGSTDNTKEVIERFQKKDSRIKYIFQENSGGPSRPNNVGIKNSNGKYIAILESDDEWLPEKLRLQIEILEKYENVGLVSCYAFRIFPDRTRKLYKTPYTGFLSKKKWKIFWQKWGIISPSTILIKKNCLSKVGLFDEALKFAFDVDFYLRFIKNFDFYFLPFSLINYYETPQSQSRGEFWKKWIPEYEYMLEKYREDFEECKKAKSRFLRTLATCYLLKGDLKKAKKYQWEAILNHPINLRLYPQFLLTLFPNLYKTILFLKRKSF